MISSAEKRTEKHESLDKLRANIKSALENKEKSKESGENKSDDEHDDEENDDEFDRKMRDKIFASRPKTQSSKSDDQDTDTKSEMNKLKKDIIESKKRAASRAFNAKIESNENNELLTPLQRKRQQYIQRNRHTKQRSEDTLTKLAKFQESLQAAKANLHSETQVPEAPSEKPKNNEKMESLIDEDDDDDINDKSWMTHQVKFVRRPQDYDPMARNQDQYEYAVFDPLNPHQQEKPEQRAAFSFGRMGDSSSTKVLSKRNDRNGAQSPNEKSGRKSPDKSPSRSRSRNRSKSRSRSRSRSRS